MARVRSFVTLLALVFYAYPSSAESAADFELERERGELSQAGGWDASVILGALEQPIREVHGKLRAGNLRIHERLKNIKPQQHGKVTHLELLNSNRFWWLMGSVMLFVACVAVSIEVNDAALATPREATEKTPIKLMPARLPEGRAEPERPHKELDKTYTDMFLKLMFCVSGLNVSMLVWGIAQEFMMTNVYISQSGARESLHSPLFLVFCNRVGSVMFSGMLSWIVGAPFLLESCLFAGMPALSNLCASWCQYSSIAFISFPLQTTAKCAKMLPVLVLSSLRGKKHSFLDYAEALVITCAVVVFGLETDGKDLQFETQGIGALLLCGMMVADSATPHLQDALFQRYPNLLVIQATFSMAVFASMASGAILLITGQMWTTLGFLGRHPDALLHIGVLSLCSTLTQFLITYTIKNFGPVAFVIIVTTRQVISVCLSSVLFMHHISLLAWVSATIVFGAVIMRSLWRMPGIIDKTVVSTPYGNDTDALDALALILPGDIGRTLMYTDTRRLLFCAVAMHVPMCFWGVAQEFMSTHTFGGELFPSVFFIISCNRVTAVCFAWAASKMRGKPFFSPSLYQTMIPGATNFLATACQYSALYYILFPQQTLMKSLKVIPVMICGAVLRNRFYSAMDYVEGALITALVLFFVWYFQETNNGEHGGAAAAGIWPGLLLMFGYVVSDSLTCNLEDHVYQQSLVDPGQMLFGAEFSSGVVSMLVLICSGQLMPALNFIWVNNDVIMHLGILALASTCGAFACTVTIRLFGPAIFTLLMMSRQILSLVISVSLFNHNVDVLSCLCLVVVSMLILTSTLRKVSNKKQA